MCSHNVTSLGGVAPETARYNHAEHTVLATKQLRLNRVVCCNKNSF